MPVTALRTKNAVESLRDVVQDLLVPELKAIKAELESTRREMRADFDAIRVEMKFRNEKQTQAIQALSEKVGLMMEVPGRLAVLEDRAKRE